MMDGTSVLLALAVVCAYLAIGCGQGTGTLPDDFSDDQPLIFPDPGSHDPGNPPSDAGDPGKPPDFCFDEAACPCIPNCLEAKCGDDGCGGSCGTCDGGKVCNEDLCRFMPMMDLGDGTLLDPGTSFLWQKIWVGEWEQSAALAYCQKNQAGLPGSGWHIPTLDELRTLIRGCSDTETEGTCAVGGDCLSEEECWHGKCAGCTFDLGPSKGCYWDDLLAGQCISYWTSSTDASLDAHAWYVDFAKAGVLTGHKANPRGLRCVRKGP